GSGGADFGDVERARAEKRVVGERAKHKMAGGGELFEQFRDGMRRVDGDGGVGCGELKARGQQRLQRGDDVGGGEEGAIGKHHAGAELELPVSRGRVVRPLDCQGRLESSVIVESDEAIVNQRGQLFVFARGKRAAFPFARIEGSTGREQFNAQGSTIARALGGACRGGREQKEQGGANSRKPE